MPNQDTFPKDELIKYLKANLLLQLRNLGADEEGETQKPEILLHRAGFTLKEIAELLEKNYEAVKKTVTRAKKEYPK
jgi:DNA-directed RNA polymerase specialized sigma24 family protein